MALTNLASATNQALTIGNLQFGDSGDYRLVATNSDGAVTSAVAHLTVNAPVMVSADALVLVEVLTTGAGFGAGMLYPVGTVSVQNAVDLHEMGTATALANGARQLGGALVVAIFGVLVIAAFGGAPGVGESFDIAHADRAALTAAFHNVFIAAVCVVVAAALCMALLEDRPMRDRDRAGAGD